MALLRRAAALIGFTILKLLVAPQSKELPLAHDAVGRDQLIKWRPDLQQVIDAHLGYRKLNRTDSKYPVLLFEDGILIRVEWTT